MGYKIKREKSKRMNKLKILFTAEAETHMLENLYHVCDFEFAGWNTDREIMNSQELIKRLQGKEVFVTSYDRVTEEVIKNCPDLKLIICARANPVNVDCEAAKKQGIKVSYTPGRNSDATAEFAVALLLNLVRNVSKANHAILSGQAILDEIPKNKNKDVTWGKVKNCHPYIDFQGPQIHGKTVGIIGYGSIGRRVGAILRGFGANLAVYDPYMSKVEVDAPGIELVSFSELLKRSDFITCHMKVTEETKGLFSKDVFAQMKKGVYFVNNSRGSLIIEEDLIEALKSHHIAGAALDVFEYEPLYKDHPFVNGEIDNVLITPHISGACPDAIANGTVLITEELLRFAEGKQMLYLK